jgi:hypothetical protein
MNETNDQLLRFGVKLLFERIEEGKIKFVNDKVPKLLEALDAVKFDDKGEPILETVTSPVRAMVNMVMAEEIEREEQERRENSPAHEFLNDPVQVNDEVLRQCAKKGDFGELAFELYKEAAIVLNLCAHIYTGESAEKHVLPRNQAICAGLLVRITKFMLAVVQMTSTAERGDVVMALNRSILETAVNLRFLVLKNEERFFDQFVRLSLGPERELYDAIQSNIQKRDDKKVLPIEKRMLASIDRACRLSGVKIEDVATKAGDWGGGMRERLRAMGEEDRYFAVQRLPSHAVHGTWVDLILHHLEEAPGGFIPDPTWSHSDARLLTPIAYLVLAAGEDYLRHYMGEMPELVPVYERMEDMKKRMRRAEEAHENWLAEKG